MALINSFLNPKTSIKLLFGRVPNPFLFPEYANSQKSYFDQVCHEPINSPMIDKQLINQTYMDTRPMSSNLQINQSALPMHTLPNRLV